MKRTLFALSAALPMLSAPALAQPRKESGMDLPSSTAVVWR